MKKILLLILSVLFAASCSSISPIIRIEAQSLPVSKLLLWDAGPVDSMHSVADSYEVFLDGASIGSPSATSQPFTITTLGSHTLSVVVKGTWGSSAPSVLNFIVSVPSQATNLKIK